MPGNRWNIAQFFEIQWWKRYLVRKDVDAYLLWKRTYWKHFLARLNLSVPDHPATTVLDAGCGPAGIFINFSNAQVTAIDPLLSNYQGLAHFHTDWYKNTSFETVPLESFTTHHTYDYVFCLNAINHVHDIERCLHNLHRSTAGDGICVISTDVHKWMPGKKLLQAAPFDILHPHQYDGHDYRMLIERAGFNVLDQQLVKPGRIFDYLVYILEK